MPGLDSPLEFARNYRIPARSNASTLWAHLLRKDTFDPTLNSSKSIPIPPITPLDKNGTSMRILLHDTQAHLDKFSARVEELCSGLSESKREISLVNTLFQHEHETLTGELVDLVNRSQTQLQASIGTPAQAEEVGRLSRDLNKHLDAIDKRIDAVQLFNQTHSQTLQLHSQALQSIQEQQKTIIATIMPLLPLIQAIPLHIKSAQNTITSIIARSDDSLSVCIPNHDQTNACSHKKKRSNDASLSDDSLSPLTNKKPRTSRDAEYLQRSSAIPTEGRMPEVDSLAISSNAPKFSSLPKPTRITPPSLTRYETTVILSPPPMIRSLFSSRNLQKSPPVKKMKMPTFTKTVNSHVDDKAQDISRFSSPFSGGISRISSRQPSRLLRVNSRSLRLGTTASDSTTSRSSTPHSVANPIEPITASSRSSATTKPVPRLQASHLLFTTRSEKPTLPMSRLATPSTPCDPFTSNSFHVVRQSSSRDPSAMLPPSSGADSHLRRPGQASRTSTPSFLSSRALAINNNLASRLPFTSPSQPWTTQHEIPTAPVLSRRRFEDVVVNQPPAGTSDCLINLIPTAVKVRERRSPFREGRRFIPLGDSDDEKDNDEGEAGNG